MTGLGLAKFAVSLLLVFAAANLMAVQQSPQRTADDRLESMEAIGTVGPYRIGFNYTVRQNTKLVAAHYFYVSRLEDIPLSGVVSGQSVHLHGTDGANFDLVFVGNGSNGKEPLTFHNSVGLRGSWSLNNRELPVELAFSHSTENPGQRMYSQVTDRSDSAFESQVEALCQAILSEDLIAASKHVHFPLVVNLRTHTLLIRNTSELQTHRSSIFTTRFLVKLRSDIPHEMFVHNGEAMLGDGELWFDDKGLVAVNPPSTPKASKIHE